MTGISKIYFNGKLYNLSELSSKQYKEIGVKIKKAIARSLGMKVIKVIYKN